MRSWRGPVDAAQISDAVRRAQAGEVEAICFLYAHFRRSVLRYVRRLIDDPFEAEDVTQQVFLKLIVVIDAYRPCGAPFSAWLRSIAHNVALDHMRRHRPIPREELEPGRPEDQDTWPKRSLALRQAFGSLPREQSRVLMFRHLVGLTPRETAERMQRQESSIHALAHRARRAMQRELIDCGYAPMVLRREDAEGRHGGCERAGVGPVG
jgi:RNA polymerase sigma-70 factor (ECF subfamily)